MFTAEDIKLVTNRRKEWIAVNPSAKETLPDHLADFMSRVLCLRFLELKVADLLQSGLDRKDAKSLDLFQAPLKVNMSDETRHDEALNNCVRALSNYNPKYEDVLLNQILPAWLDLSDFPILTALTLENGLFFLILPWMRKYGTPSMTTTSSDISVDETTHVILHRMVCSQLKLRPSKKIDKLRRATVRWLVGDYSDENITVDKALKVSDNLYYNGVSDSLNYQQSSQMPAFFEIENASLPYYV